MGFHFRKRIKLLPGVHLNLSKSGISTSVGVKGASVNMSKRGTYINTSIPGTGIYGRHKLSGTGKRRVPESSRLTNPEVLIHHSTQRYPAAAVLSFFIPGLGQLIKGALFKALLIWIVGGALCILFWSTTVVPLFVWLWNVYDAYRTVPKLQGL